MLTARQRELYDQVMNASRWLRLRNQKIGDAGAHAIAEALKLNTTVTWLDLGENQIGDAGAHTIAEALQVNTTVAVLLLEQNSIGDAGAQAIAETLKVKKEMRDLRLQNNQIGDAGAQALAQALSVNTTITTLSLGGNQIGNVGAQALAEALKVNTTLTQLELLYNCIGSVGTRAIDETCTVDRTCEVDTNHQISPIAFSLPPRLSTAEDLQLVFRLLIGGSKVENQCVDLPVLPAEIAERIMDEAYYWQNVHSTKRAWFGADDPDHILKVKLPHGVNGASIRVKAIHVFRDVEQNPYNTDEVFEMIVRDERGAIQSEFVATPTSFVDSTDLVTILPARHPIIRQIREGWEVHVRPSKTATYVVFEALYVGFTKRMFNW
ncbi:hypothetical protein CAOG_00424 [Capsaspora owczarzaki ATCC 30864]|uniref:NOD3 protein n=1 Tax=Capsaspora owczarzaki (strain ATCC 30864) TaxID=595528 RepID=A0A0D2VG69_CAPO3|nr:hypothetical protein CAOG_00424 [Capsaspora owczarzaki ATCC 30864]KJE88847.1 hypothetical protein CAOG_000424 [Capsaspora owczarzaki ATCC 30864]|eukprot:XP_004365295.2 hypothetical protein CAOG_00424 [Capsaspora owczarzaki ATCC 30864]